MKSIIICEGYTDCVLLQYFLRKVYGWKDGGRDKVLESTFKSMRVLKKASDTVRIGGCGGCSEIIPKLNFILDMNNVSAEKDAEFDRIVIITDRDEIETEQDFISRIKYTLAGNHVTAIEEIKNNEWSLCTYCNGRGKSLQIQNVLQSVKWEDYGNIQIGFKKLYDLSVSM
ncbi:MAG: hypothetical protein Q4C61_12735 [Lachnospiraceae bacterium]|nr:hypothetical protein [Lachnospiraceae bacterium]